MLIREDWHRLVRPLALLAVVGVVASWDRIAPPRVELAVAPVAEDLPPAPRLSEEQRQLAEQKCARKSGEEFRRGWSEGTFGTAEGSETAAFENHYNERLDVCFYELTVVRHVSAGGGDAVLVRKMLFDVDERELYGEYRGAESGGSPGAPLPKVCRVAGLYCASRREWDVLVEPFMAPQVTAP